MSLPWYAFHREKYKRDTLHLTLAQDGAYRRLLDAYYENGGPLPDNDVALARLIGVTLDEWMAVAGTVRAFFKPSNGKLVQKCCEEELRAQSMLGARRSEKASNAAKAKHQKYRELKAIVAASTPQASPEHAQALLNPATLQSKKERGANPPARSLATAPPTGALAREPSSEQAAKRTSSEGMKASPSLVASVVSRGWS